MSLIQADARKIPLADGSVHCVVTSPPYWGLRDYGTATWQGGRVDCDHLGPPRMSDKTGLSHPELKPREQILAEPSRLVPTPFRDVCRKCGATRIDNQLGLERTPEEYVGNMVAVFGEVRRVLRDDGVLWLNLGDTYCSNFGRGAKRESSWWSSRNKTAEGKGYNEVDTTHPPNNDRKVMRHWGVKVKDLVGIPWRVAFALQADGWYLRSDVIWSKPNPMPESVRDRPTKAHEYVFLLTKSGRYWWDAEAVREDSDPFSIQHGRRYGDQPSLNAKGNPHRNDGGGSDRGKHCGVTPGREKRNIRTVWHIATQPYSGAHYAVMPERLVERCILAGCPGRACANCGAPQQPIVERKPMVFRPSARQKEKHDQGLVTALHGTMLEPPQSRTVGWKADCDCETDYIGGTVLDPFVGSGTVVKVARNLGRHGVGLDLSREYLTEQAAKRIRTQQGLPL